MCAGTGAASMFQGHVLFGGLGFVLSMIATAVVISGRNPPWLHSALDPREPRSDARPGAEPRRRGSAQGPA